MGGCTSNHKIKIISQRAFYSGKAAYPLQICANIKKKDSRGRIINIEKINILHTEPLLCISEDLSTVFNA